jgi:hypothetical protein
MACLKIRLDQRLFLALKARMRALISAVRRFRSAAGSALAGTGKCSICSCRRAASISGGRPL